MDKRLLGLTLIVVGSALVMWGYEQYDTAPAQLARSLGGNSPLESWAAMIGGAVCVLIGALRL